MRHLVLTVLLPLTAVAGPADKGSAPVTLKHCEKLVEQLANPHKPPFPGRSTTLPELPPGISETALLKQQRPVQDAYVDLGKNFSIALPAIVKGVRDERYSYTSEVARNGCYENSTVGNACSRLIYRHVEIHAPITTTLDNDQFFHGLSYIEHCGGIEKWWKSRSKMTLAEMQLETLDWVVKLERPQHFKSERDWRMARNSASKLAVKIRTEKKPVLVKDTLQFFGR